MIEKPIIKGWMLFQILISCSRFLSSHSIFFHIRIVNNLFFITSATVPPTTIMPPSTAIRTTKAGNWKWKNELIYLCPFFYLLRQNLLHYISLSWTFLYHENDTKRLESLMRLIGFNQRIQIIRLYLNWGIKKFSLSVNE